MKVIFLCSFLSFLGFNFSFKEFKNTKTLSGFTIKVQVKGFENNKGKAYVALYDPKEKMIKGLVENIVNKQVTVNFADLPSGKYAVKVYHDENSNGKLDTGLFGIPKEKWGVSNNVKVFVSAPKIEELLFDLNTDKSIAITLK